MRLVAGDAGVSSSSQLPTRMIAAMSPMTKIHAMIPPRISSTSSFPPDLVSGAAPVTVVAARATVTVRTPAAVRRLAVR